MQTPEQEQAISGLRAAYEAFNRGDIAEAVELFDPQIEWTEPQNSRVAAPTMEWQAQRLI